MNGLDIEKIVKKYSRNTKEPFTGYLVINRKEHKRINLLALF